MNNLLTDTTNWIREDWQSNPLRCTLEIFAWLLSIGCAFTMMLIVPTPPFLILYPLFITQCIIFAWAAWTLKKFGNVGQLLSASQHR